MRAYGLEILLRKNTGKLNGWVAYTLSRSEQKTPGRNERVMIKTPDGKMEFMKFKKAGPFLKLGCEIV